MIRTRRERSKTEMVRTRRERSKTEMVRTRREREARLRWLGHVEREKQD